MHIFFFWCVLIFFFDAFIFFFDTCLAPLFQHIEFEPWQKEPWRPRSRVPATAMKVATCGGKQLRQAQAGITWCWWLLAHFGSQIPKGFPILGISYWHGWFGGTPETPRVTHYETAPWLMVPKIRVNPCKSPMKNNCFSGCLIWTGQGINDGEHTFWTFW